MRFAFRLTTFAFALFALGCAQHARNLRHSPDLLATGDLPGVRGPSATAPAEPTPATAGLLSGEVPPGTSRGAKLPPGALLGVISLERISKLRSPLANIPVVRLGNITIAPFPVPGDTSRASAERMKLLNLPKAGTTMVAPMPPPNAPGGARMFRSRDGGKYDVPSYGDSSHGEFLPPERVDVFPEATLRVPPEYPESARKAGIQGTVMVMARLRTDGTVGETRVVKSIPHSMRPRSWQ